MKNYLSIVFLVSILLACDSKREEQLNMEGKWDALWKTDPASFQDVPSVNSFEMNGEFVFEGENLTVVAMGYPGCVFGEDTISHTQKWELKGDTLNLISKPGVYGISYSIGSIDENQMELKLVEDITVTLSRSSN